MSERTVLSSKDEKPLGVRSSQVDVQTSEEETEGLQHTITVIIPVFGDMSVWLPLAQRAFESVEAQTVAPTACYISKGDNLAEARNKLIFDGTVDTERVIFLDADDQLHPEFIEQQDKVEGDIIQPATTTAGSEPRLLPPADITKKNFLICGCPVKTAHVVSVGGFDEDLEALEDWWLWIEIILKCGPINIQPHPKAIYKITARPNSRNRQPEARNLVAVLQKRATQLQRELGFIE